jgi:hypothetical protein
MKLKLSLHIYVLVIRKFNAFAFKININHLKTFKSALGI